MFLNMLLNIIKVSALYLSKSLRSDKEDSQICKKKNKKKKHIKMKNGSRKNCKKKKTAQHDER